MDLQPDRRIFLGLDAPPLVGAVQWLIDRYSNNDQQINKDHNKNYNCPPNQPANLAPAKLDLGNVTIVVSTTRAQIRLLQLLVQNATQHSRQLTPPLITTVGQFPELLYAAEKELATDLAQQIAWSKALAETPKDEIRTLVGRTDIDRLDDWQPMAKVLSRLHRQLANDVWSFSSVAREVKKLKGFIDQEIVRWDVLEKIQQRYYAQLASVDLWDRQAARNVAIHRESCSTTSDVILVGVADLNHSVRRMLGQIADRVTPLVAATPAMARRFDPFGNLLTIPWAEQSIDIPDEQIRIVDRPADQAFAAVHFITNLTPSPSSDEITIGVPDENVIPQLERNLDAIGLNHRSLPGRTLADTTPVRLMLACREYLLAQDYDSFASLVRHPDLFQWLAEKTEKTELDGWLGGLAIFQNNKLPARIAVESPHPFGDPADLLDDFDRHDPSSRRRATKNSEIATGLNQIHAAIGNLLTPLMGPPQPIADWTAPWSQILIEIYADREVEPNSHDDRQLIKACEALFAALGDHHQIPASWEMDVTATTALDMAIEAATESRVVDPAIENAVELAGWLDLIMDDAPVMVITGMNDENVPAADVGHQFLPNKLCEQLGIEDNRRRFARDVYALTVIGAVRADLLLIAGRQDEKNNPKKPSRLLFATDAQSAARRAQAFFSFGGKTDSRFWLTDNLDFPTHQQLAIPQPTDVEPLKSLTVTSFKEFLKCPYRFYLGKVLRLESVEDNWRELNGGLFGDLAHNVLEAFGRHEIRKSEDASLIYEFLSDQLTTQAQRAFQGTRLPSVRIQIEQLRLRFEMFSEHQAHYREQGWLIVSVEEMLYHSLTVDGQPFQIRGKIDRVDRNELDDRVAIWDYKTSDRGDTPGAAHYGPRTGWKDLQLPLYRYLVQHVDAVKDCDLSAPSLGYVLLPKQIDNIGFSSAQWNADLLRSADEKAFEVIRRIRENSYWPPAPKPPQFSEDFAAICQDNVFERFPISTPESEPSDETVEAPF